MCDVNNQRHLQTDGERWRTIVGPRRSSAAAAGEEKSGSSRPAVLSTCQYFRRQSCSPGLFVSAGEKRYLMEWVVDGQTWYTAQTDHTEKFTCPWQSKNWVFMLILDKCRRDLICHCYAFCPTCTLILMYFRLSSGSAWLVS